MRAEGRTRRLAAALLLAAAAPAGAADLTASADLSYAEESATAQASRYARQRYELTYGHAVSDALSYQLRGRYSQVDGSTSWVAGSSHDDGRDVGGQGTFSWHRDWAAATLQHELEVARTSYASATASDSRMQRTLASLWFDPARSLRVTTGAEVTETSVSSSPTFRQENATAVVNYAGHPVQALGAMRLQRFEQGDTVATSWGPRLELGWSGDFGRETYASVRYTTEYARSDLSSPMGGARVTFVEVTAAAALYANDPSALDDSDAPLSSVPALLDRNFIAGAGVAIGTDGVSFQNLALDLGHVAQLEGVRVSVRTPGGLFVASGGPVTWAAYWSNDAVRWTALPSGAIFDPVLGAYDVTFPRTSARYFKVVNFGTNTVDTVVTELQGFVHATLPPSTRDSWAASQLHAVSASVGAAPWEKLRLSYTGTFGATGYSSDLMPAFVWSRDTSHGASVFVGPFGPFQFQVDHARWDSWQALQPAAQSAATSALVTWRPVPAGSLGLLLSNGLTRTQGMSALNNTAGLQGALNLYGSTQVAASAQFVRSDVSDGSTFYSVSGSGSVTSRVRYELSVGATVSVQRDVSESRPAGSQPLPQLLMTMESQSYRGFARWMPTQRLWMELQLGYGHSPFGEGLVETARISWTSPGAPITVGLDFANELDPLSGREFRRLYTQARWGLNRHMTLTVSYTGTWGTGPGNEDLGRDAVFVTFSFRS
jgi:hypothetical protein